jgi:hypothetical protein
MSSPARGVAVVGPAARLFVELKFVLVVGDTSAETKRLRKLIQDHGGSTVYSITSNVRFRLFYCESDEAKGHLAKNRREPGSRKLGFCVRLSPAENWAHFILTRSPPGLRLYLCLLHRLIRALTACGALFCLLEPVGALRCVLSRRNRKRRI